MSICIFAIEPHESAKRDPVEGIFGRAELAETKRPRRIPDPELFHANAKDFCCNEMTQLMGDDEDDEDQGDECDGKHVKLTDVSC